MSSERETIEELAARLNVDLGDEVDILVQVLETGRMICTLRRGTPQGAVGPELGFGTLPPGEHAIDDERIAEVTKRALDDLYERLKAREQFEALRKGGS